MERQDYADVFSDYAKEVKKFAEDEPLLTVLGIPDDWQKPTRSVFCAHARCAMMQPHTKLPSGHTWMAYPKDDVSDEYKRDEPCAFGDQCIYHEGDKLCPDDEDEEG